MPTPADRAAAILPGRGEPPWPDHEFVRGWGVFGLPFDSGHVLALRVFPQNSFAPYSTVWHRDPDGRWSIFVDGSSRQTACPRYYGAACHRITDSRIDLDWEGPRSLRVRVDDPALDWRLTLKRSPIVGLLNPLGAALPLGTWRVPAVRRARELMARGLGLGRIELSGPMPSGHVGLLMPERMHLIGSATATLEGADLGIPARVAENPEIGGVTLPARGVLSFGQAVWKIRDREEFDRLRADAADVDVG
ncbi:MAG TPA: hypothetical protein VFE07_08715 [Marmoricola sp.]|nr:hypothetical protein [Marmoricola sp.]